jgi:hypothetical protein
MATRNSRRIGAAWERLEARDLMAANVVLDWNEAAIAAIRAERTPPPVVSRNLAIAHIAVYDAVNAIDRTNAPYQSRMLAAPTTSREAAAASAAHRALSALFPSQTAAFDALLAAGLSAVPDGPAETAGVALGIQAADAILAARADDGWNTLTAYQPTSEPGRWQPTPAGFAAALLPQWANLRPFAMASPSQFTPNKVPSLSSQEYATAFNEVKTIGAANSATRTADQTAIAQFWNNGAGTATPPGHLNRLAAIVATARRLTVSETARLFAATNVAMADAAIMAWNAKYASDLWRPVTAIRAADTDGNSNTSADANWTPLIATPPFPAYVSGHASFSGAAAAVFRAFFGSDSQRFTLPSEYPNLPPRSYATFSQAAQESADSRLYGGIHWRFDNADGLAAGRRIGNYVFGSLFRPQAWDAAAGVVDGQLVVIGTDRADNLAFSASDGQVVVRNQGNILGAFPLANFTTLVVDARGGNDRVALGDAILVSATIFGGSGDDFITGGGAGDTIFGGLGKDYIVGGGGDDLLDGGDGDDWLIGGFGVDVLVGGRGRNRLTQ